MSRDEDFRIRPGRIRSSKTQRAKPFVAQALAAARKVGGRVTRSGKITSGRGPHFARGRTASIRANRFITSRTRLRTVKALIVSKKGERGPLARHLNYLRREGVTRDGERAKMFGPVTDDADASQFSDRCKDDRHQFRFIVSPEDAAYMEDLKRFTRELMAQAEKDLGARLDCVASIIGTPTTRLSMSSCAAAPTTAGISSSTAATSRAGCATARRISSRRSSAPFRPRDQPLARASDRDRALDAARPPACRDSNEHDVIDVAPSPDRQPHDCPTQKVGRLCQRFVLSSGRFAMIDDGLDFKLVPWTPSIEKHIGRHISGVTRGDGGVDWSFGRKGGLGL